MWGHGLPFTHSPNVVSSLIAVYQSGHDARPMSLPNNGTSVDAQSCACCRSRAVAARHVVPQDIRRPARARRRAQRARQSATCRRPSLGPVDVHWPVAPRPRCCCARRSVSNFHGVVNVRNGGPRRHRGRSCCRQLAHCPCPPPGRDRVVGLTEHGVDPSAFAMTRSIGWRARLVVVVRAVTPSRRGPIVSMTTVPARGVRRRPVLSS